MTPASTARKRQGAGGFLILTAALAFLPVLDACDARGGRVLVLALDGVDPGVVDLLVSEGKLPGFARLRQGGAYGRLASQEPLLSPIVWTTIATGKRPDQHRIGHFVAVDRATGDRLPVTSRMRGARALWNIATDADRTVSVVGWWATWPAEPVRGTIVSDHLCYHFLFEDAFGDGSAGSAGRTYPPELEQELLPLVRRPDSVTLEEASAFVTVTADEIARPFTFSDDLAHFKWALATADSYEAIGLHLWETRQPDLMMVYIEAVDTTSHLFGHLFRTESLAGELAEQRARYGAAVERIYERVDRLIEAYLRAIDGRTTLVVLSDHGFRLGTLPDDPSVTRDMRRVSDAFHTPMGVLYLYGRRVTPYTRLDAPSILDVAPTILSLLDVPAGRDMPGRVLTEALRGPVPPARVATHEVSTDGSAPLDRDSVADAEILRKLESLGYLGTDSPSGDRNLAAILFESGRFEESARAYRALVESSPRSAALRVSLAGALGAMGKYDEAFEHLTVAIEIDPLAAEAYHNRAVIHERRSDLGAAARDYRTALRYNPRYEPSRQALTRLQGTDHLFEPETPARRRALALAQEASLAARRGGYAEAMRLLDEAGAAAPDFALVYQYRSNVAYLMGDRAGAIAALRKGLALEPDNALFQVNLRRLEEAPP